MPHVCLLKFLVDVLPIPNLASSEYVFFVGVFTTVVYNTSLFTILHVLFYYYENIKFISDG